MADRYFTYPRGGSVYFHNSLWWSTSLGGSGGASVPTTGDVAHFQGVDSGGILCECIVNAPVLCSIDTSGQYDNTSFIVTTGGSVTLQADLTGFRNLTVGGGTLNSNGFNISTFREIYFTGGTSIIGSSTLTLTDDLYSGTSNVFSASSGTVDFSAATIICEALSAWVGGDRLYGTVEINCSTALFHYTEFHGNGTFNNLSILKDGEMKFRNDLGDQTITVLNGLTIEGDTSGGLELYAKEASNDIIFSKSDGHVDAKNATLTNCVATGGALFTAYLTSGNVDGGSNSGWDWTNTRAVPPVSAMTLTGYNPSRNVYSVDYATSILIGYAPRQATAFLIPVGDMALSAQIPRWVWSMAIPVVTATITPGNPSYVWAIPLSQQSTAKVIFSCTLTGAPDGLSDLTLPMSSFQARMRDGDPSYVSVVVPSSATYAAAIVARANGEIIIKKGYLMRDGSAPMEEIARVDYESIQIDQGANNDSLTLAGHKTVASTVSSERTMTGVSYYGLQANGKRRVRANLNLFLRCGDVCIYGDDPAERFTVGNISYFVGANPVQMIMEAGEA